LLDLNLSLPLLCEGGNPLKEQRIKKSWLFFPSNTLQPGAVSFAINSIIFSNGSPRWRQVDKQALYAFLFLKYYMIFLEAKLDADQFFLIRCDRVQIKVDKVKRKKKGKREGGWTRLFKVLLKKRERERKRKKGKEEKREKEKEGKERDEMEGKGRKKERSLVKALIISINIRPRFIKLHSGLVVMRHAIKIMLWDLIFEHAEEMTWGMIENELLDIASVLLCSVNKQEEEEGKAKEEEEEGRRREEEEEKEEEQMEEEEEEKQEEEGGREREGGKEENGSAARPKIKIPLQVKLDVFLITTSSLATQKHRPKVESHPGRLGLASDPAHMHKELKAPLN
ncbi:hypothetical protein E2320_012949, partial [Naja naja]